MAEAIKVRVTKQGANGPRGLDARGVISQSFVIPATVTDSEPFQLENNFLVNGETQFVTIDSIFGTITKTNGYYTFKRKTAGLETTATVGTNVFIVVDPVESDNKNPLRIGTVTLSQENDETLVLQGNFALYDKLSTLFSVESDSGWSFVIKEELSNLIAFGIKDDGSISFRRLSQDFLFGDVEFLQNADPDYVLPIGDEQGAIAFGLRKLDGAVEIQKLSIAENELSNYLYESDYEMSVFDENGTISTAYQKDTGAFLISKAHILSYENEICNSPQVVPGVAGSILYTKVVNGFQQIFSFAKATAIETQLTTLGNNVQPYFDTITNKIYFSSDRAGQVGLLSEKITEQPTPYQMDPNGQNQEDIFWSSNAAQNNIDVIWYNGQSNSVSSEGYVGIDGYPSAYLDNTVPPGTNNLKLLDSTGNYTITNPNAATLSLAPLTDIHKALGSTAYPTNNSGAGLCAPLGNQLSQLLGNSHITFVSSTGQGGTGYSVWGPSGTGNAYEAGLYESRAAKRLADAQGKTIQMVAAIVIAGENDALRPTADYKADHYTYFNRVQLDQKPIFGQTKPIPLLLTQQHCFATDAGPSNSAQAQFEAARDHPLICLVEPTYQHRMAPTTAGGTSVHLDGWSHRRRAFKLAHVAVKIFRHNQQWVGLTPIKIRFDSTNSKIIVTLNVPYAPLRFDPWMPAPVHAWPNGKGFEVVDAASTPIPINSAIIVGDTVELTIPSGANPAIVRYAMSAAAQSGSYLWGDRNNPNSRRGALCDSEPAQGYDKQTLVCNVTNGSANVTIGATGFLQRGWYDRVTGASLAAGAIISNRISDTQLALSNPWGGATGTASLTFWYDLSNYCQAFIAPIKYN
jgi:hypothetical protein